MPRAIKETSRSRRKRGTSALTPYSSNGSVYCATCDKEFSRPFELKRHLEQTLIHNPNAKRFQCRYCGSLHTQKANLKTHERIHLNQRKEHCNLPRPFNGTEKCSFSCNDPSSMTRHIDNIHIFPFLNQNMPVPDWLVKELDERKEASRRTATSSPAIPPSNSPTPPLTCSSGSIPSTPLPYAGVSPVLNGAPKPAELDSAEQVNVHNLRPTDNYIAPQPVTNSLPELGNFHFDNSLGQKCPSKYQQLMNSSALFIQSPIHEAVAQYNQSLASSDFHLTVAENGQGLSLEPLTLDNMVPAFPRPSVIQVNSTAAPTHDDSTCLIAEPAIIGMPRASFDHIPNPLDLFSPFDGAVQWELNNFS